MLKIHAIVQCFVYKRGKKLAPSGKGFIQQLSFYYVISVRIIDVH